MPQHLVTVEAEISLSSCVLTAPAPMHFRRVHESAARSIQTSLVTNHIADVSLKRHLPEERDTMRRHNLYGTLRGLSGFLIHRSHETAGLNRFATFKIVYLIFTRH
jgi:hypothetical protein